MQAIRSLPKFDGLLRREPVPDSNPQFLDTLDAPDAGRQVGTKQTAVGRFISESANCSQTQVDRGGCQFPGLKVDTVTEHHGPIERQPGLRTVPFDELLDRMAISALSVGRTEAV